MISAGKMGSKHSALAFTYLSETNQEKAIPELQETLRLNPACEPAQQALAKVQRRAGGY